VRPVKDLNLIGVDVFAAKRYSVPIHGKYLVIIANPVKHRMHAKFPAPLPFQKFWTEATPPVMSAVFDLLGGHFSA
jgi:hypothetical protein